jgi:Ser/Thr protein kinase RdoA (MazF antagonist)
MSDFAELTHRQQVSRLRRTALQVLAEWPIEVTGLRLIIHDYNTTFRVDTATGAAFALRINVNSRRTPAQLNAEAEWLAALARDTDISVPTPQHTKKGALRADVYVEELERSLPAVLMSWLPGRVLGFRASAAKLRAVGQLMAALHDHAADWPLPAECALPRFDHPLFNDADRLTDHEDADQWGPGAREVVAEAMTRTCQAFDEVFAHSPVFALHADLHGANLMWQEDRLAVFDFDDSGLGPPLLDLAISAYYLRSDPRREKALLDGYASARAFPDFTTDQYEGLLASRNLLMMNDLLGSATASVRDFRPRYLRNSIRKLRHYLDTGSYLHRIEGLET